MARFCVNPPASMLPACTAVLSGRGVRYHVHGYRTTLTVKAVRRGAVWYETSAGRALVGPDDVLVLNHGRQYAMDFAGDVETETLCSFFEPGFVEEVAVARETTVGAALEDPDRRAGGLEFPEALVPRDGRLGAVLDELGSGVRADGAPEPWLEDRFRALAHALVERRGARDRMRDSLPALRAATREELLRRLERARDFILSGYARRLTVADVAREAGMAPSHLHRLFRRAFGRTPMQALQARRLAFARRLLETTDLPVTDVAARVGFESLGSFSWLFHRRFGRSPRAWRANSQD